MMVVTPEKKPLTTQELSIFSVNELEGSNLTGFDIEMDSSSEKQEKADFGVLQEQKILSQARETINLAQDQLEIAKNQAEIAAFSQEMMRNYEQKAAEINPNLPFADQVENQVAASLPDLVTKKAQQAELRANPETGISWLARLDKKIREITAIIRKVA